MSADVRVNEARGDHLTKDELSSRTFPGRWLDVEALLKDDLVKALDVPWLRLASSEHTDFIK